MEFRWFVSLVGPLLQTGLMLDLSVAVEGTKAFTASLHLYLKIDHKVFIDVDVSLLLVKSLENLSISLFMESLTALFCK